MSFTQRLKSLRHFGLIWGFLGYILGNVVGIGLTVIIRGLQGLETWEELSAWNAFAEIQPGGPIAIATTFGTLLGTVGFLLGIGALSDWGKWFTGRKASDGHFHKKEGVPAWYRYFSFDTNHKVVGIQYGVASFLALMVGGLMALIFRMELTNPGLQVFQSEETYNTYIGMHGLLMIIGVLLGVGAISNYLVPLMIGAQDMAFPRLNGFAFWIGVPAVFMMFTAFLVGGFDTGWTAYPPLSVRSPIGIQFALLAVIILGFGSITGAINLLVTIFLMRAPGMTWFRLPIFVWGVVAASLLQATATQFFGLAFLGVLLERLTQIPFFNPALGGDVTLYQHVFWFYSHPTVYIWVLPGLGLISEMFPVFARKPLFGYKAIALSSLAISFMGYLVWAHHMFTSAMDPFLRLPFMLATLVIAVPTGIKFFNWIGTLWGGKIHFQTPMLFAIGAFILFLFGGLTGPPNGLVVTGMHLHDTHWVVAHFHITVFGGFFFTYLAAIYYWFPKATGKMYNENLGRLHFATMFAGFLIFALALFRIGVLGMPRRYADYPEEWLFSGSNSIATVGAFLSGLSMLIFFFNIIISVYAGKKAPANPWRSLGMEWQIKSPVPEYNYSQIPQVVGNPYDYGLPGAVYAVVAPEDRPDEEESPQIDTPSSDKMLPGNVAPAPAGD